MKTNLSLSNLLSQTLLFHFSSFRKLKVCQIIDLKFYLQPTHSSQAAGLPWLFYHPKNTRSTIKLMHAYFGDYFTEYAYHK
jgi:hypothetical protein